MYVQVVGSPGSPLRLTNDDVAHVHPSWSPDGRVLALWHVKGGDSGATLVLISPLGGPERALFEWAGTTSRISWSPDSQWIAIANYRPGDRGIVLVSAASGARIDWRTLNPALAGSGEPMFSPDGKRLAYIRTTGDFTGEAYVIGVADEGRPLGEPVRLPIKETEVHEPVWTRDGKELLLRVGDMTSNGGIVRVHVDGSQPPERIASLRHAYSTAISRDGTKLAFTRGGTDSDLWRVDLLHPEQSTAIARSSLFDASAAYSPDGRRIAFSSNRSGTREIWVADENGDKGQPLTRFGGPIDGVPRWSPDGQHIVFDARPDGHADVFIIAAAGGSVRRLTTEKGEDARPVWSPDGKWIYFSSDRGGRSEIWRMTPAGEKPAQITRTGASPSSHRMTDSGSTIDQPRRRSSCGASILMAAATRRSSAGRCRCSASPRARAASGSSGTPAESQYTLRRLREARDAPGHCQTPIRARRLPNLDLLGRAVRADHERGRSGSDLLIIENFR